MNTKIANRPTITIAFFLLAVIYFLVNLVWKQPVLAAALKLAPNLVIFVSALLIRYGLRDSSSPQYRTKIPYSVVLAVGASIVGDLAGEFKPGFGYNALIFQILFFSIAQIFYAISFLKFSGKRKIGKAGKWELVIKAILVCAIIAYLVFVAIAVYQGIEDVVICVAVSIYMLLIAWMALMSVIQRRPDQGWFVTGAIFFCISDSVLAINTFVRPVAGASLLIMSTYFIAQYCLNIRLFPKR